VISKIFSSYII